MEDTKSLKASSTGGRTFVVTNPSDTDESDEGVSTSLRHKTSSKPTPSKSEVTSQREKSAASPASRPNWVDARSQAHRPLPMPAPLTTNLPPSHVPYPRSRSSNPALSSPSSTSSPQIESTPPPSTPGLSTSSIYEQPTSGDKEITATSQSIIDRLKRNFGKKSKGLGSSQSPTATTPDVDSITSASTVSSHNTSISEKLLIMVTRDCENYTAADISGARDAAFIRERIFAKLLIPDDEQKHFSIYRTEVGSFATTLALSDKDLFREATKSRGSPNYFFASHSSAPAHDHSTLPISPTTINTIPPPVLPYQTNYTPLRPKGTPGQGSVSSASGEKFSAYDGGDESASDDLAYFPDRSKSHRTTLRQIPLSTSVGNSSNLHDLEALGRATHGNLQRQRSVNASSQGPTDRPRAYSNPSSDARRSNSKKCAVVPPLPSLRKQKLPAPPPAGHIRSLSSNSAAEREEALEKSEREAAAATSQWKDEHDRRKGVDRPPPSIPLPIPPSRDATSPEMDIDEHSDTSGTLHRSPSRSRARPKEPAPPVPIVPESHSRSGSSRNDTSSHNRKHSPGASAQYSNAYSIVSPSRPNPSSSSSSRGGSSKGIPIGVNTATYLTSPSSDTRRPVQAQPMPSSKPVWARLTKSTTKSMGDLNNSSARRGTTKQSSASSSNNKLSPAGGPTYNTLDISRRDNPGSIAPGYTSILDSRPTPSRPLPFQNPYQSSSSQYMYRDTLHSPTSITGNSLIDPSRTNSGWVASLPNTRFRSHTQDHNDASYDNDPRNSPLTSPRSGGNTWLTIGNNQSRRLQVTIAPTQPTRDPYSSPSVRTPPRSPTSPRHSRPRTAEDQLAKWSRGATLTQGERPTTAGEMYTAEREKRRSGHTGTIVPGDSSTLRPLSMDGKKYLSDYGEEGTVVASSSTKTAPHIGESPSIRSSNTSTLTSLEMFGTPNYSSATLLLDDQFESDEESDDGDDKYWNVPPTKPNQEASNETLIERRRKSRSNTLQGRGPPLTVQINGESAPPPSSWQPPAGGTPGSADTFVGKPKRKDSQRSSTFADKEEQTWAPRPPPEDMYEHLEKFFPGHDLDQPVIEATSSATSPTTAAYPSLPPPVPDKDRNGRGGLVKAKKSIRYVAEEHKKRIDRTSRAVSGGMSRKRSTRLWDRELEEVTNGQSLPSLAKIHPESPAGGKQKITWVRGELIGKGTYGRVYLAMNASTGEMIAVKQVEIPTTDSDKADERQATFVRALKSESETLKDLDHPNVVQYLGFEETPECLSIFLEYVPGGTVGSSLLKHGRFDDDVTKSFTSQILTGLEYLHSRRILHRDLKADNILVETTGICKISDFGISKQTDLINGDGAATAMQGTVFWMAPEVIDPVGGYDHQIDIWSLGCVLHEMWTAERPWAPEAAFTVILRVAKQKLSPPLPESLVLEPLALDFRNRCFAPDPRDRPSASILRKHQYLDLPQGWYFRGFASGPSDGLL